VITVAMATTISVTPIRVWRALTVPAELMGWDEHLLASIDPVEDFPHEGQRVRWRYRFGGVAVVLRSSLFDVVPLERLRSISAIGLFRFDETFSLCNEAGDPERTRLRLKLVAANSLPVVGGMLDRFAVRRLATDIVDRKLRSLQKWCENRA
jgi:hypothetical protein